MRDSHPAEKLDRTCDYRGYDAPRTGFTVPPTFDRKSGRCAQGMLADAAYAMVPGRRLSMLRQSAGSTPNAIHCCTPTGPRSGPVTTLGAPRAPLWGRQAFGWSGIPGQSLLGLHGPNRGAGSPTESRSGRSYRTSTSYAPSTASAPAPCPTPASCRCSASTISRARSLSPTCSGRKQSCSKR